MLKEQVAKLTGDRFKPPAESAGLKWDENFNLMLAQEILNLFKAEVDKLIVIDAMDIYKQFCSSGLSGGVSLAEYLTQAQLQHTKKQLLEGLEG